ncbi:MAG: hypothetical protein Q4D90_03965 [bacterium]|nr:hypothetical protein [bacterium]
MNHPLDSSETLTKQALQYASILEEENALLPAPAHMKAEILEKSRRPEVQLLVRTQAVAQKLDFFLYSLRVGFAVVCALFMLTGLSRFSSNLSYFSDREAPPITGVLQHKTQEVNTYLNHVSQSIFTFEMEDLKK